MKIRGALILCIFAVSILACGLNAPSDPLEVTPAADQGEAAAAGPESTAPAEEAGSFPATPAPETFSGTGRPRLALIGDEGHIRDAAEQIGQLGEYIITENTGAETADLVLFTEAYIDGPMPQTRQEIAALQGMTLARAAILYTTADLMNDPELEELIDQELRELLMGVMPAEAVRGLPSLELPSPDFAAQLQALLDQEAEGILLE